MEVDMKQTIGRCIPKNNHVFQKFCCGKYEKNVIDNEKRCFESRGDSYTEWGVCVLCGVLVGIQHEERFFSSDRNDKIHFTVGEDSKVKKMRVERR